MDTTGSAFTPLIFLFTFMILLYFMSVRPQQKRAKELQNMMNNLEKGDEVIAASGILGKVKEIKGDYVAIEVSENITFKLQKNAISNTLPKGTIASINS
ncbi:MAG: preprotein translocase subunit YajC [SAR86 cluster bacterium]|jgi:preprotein translocase subunit YajC|uniref:Sec translocon accessory complex subunit YajC n=1 Tax=SAR86 cluster bacterium TaxID=2030880 RepID=A0A937SHZ3_9GAMM|nr:preprotein translocase subunit YajC [SAR86 cluster bacterium]MDG1202242.1 preprotein translocase subunit YajC [SAR86 cluster bacterium]MDG1721715.1 preprotein translocase subunit YajC [SAR86 cluster bacterium]|tara:strand:- start:3554 stop:3850 length:297 start_codon:yes stop_codon:yes gene_type:complete